MGQIQETQLAPAGSGGNLTSVAKSVPTPAQAVAIQFEVENVAAAAAPAGPSATSATISGSQAIATYFYEVSAVTPQGLESAVSTEVHSTISTSTGSTTLSWSTVSNTDHYRVYWSTGTGTEAHFFTTTTAAFTDDGTLGAGTAGIPLATNPTVTWKVQGSFDNRNFYDIPFVTEATATESQATASQTSAGAKIRWVALAPTRFFPLYRVVVTTTVASQLTYNVTAFTEGP